MQESLREETNYAVIAEKFDGTEEPDTPEATNWLRFSSAERVAKLAADYLAKVDNSPVREIKIINADYEVVKRYNKRGEVHV